MPITFTFPVGALLFFYAGYYLVGALIIVATILNLIQKKMQKNQLFNFFVLVLNIFVMLLMLFTLASRL